MDDLPEPAVLRRQAERALERIIGRREGHPVIVRLHRPDDSPPEHERESDHEPER